MILTQHVLFLKPKLGLVLRHHEMTTLFVLDAGVGDFGLSAHAARLPVRQDKLMGILRPIIWLLMCRICRLSLTDLHSMVIHIVRPPRKILREQRFTRWIRPIIWLHSVRQPPPLAKITFSHGSRSGAGGYIMLTYKLGMSARLLISSARLLDAVRDTGRRHHRRVILVSIRKRYPFCHSAR